MKMNRKVPVYIGFPSGHVEDESYRPVIADSISGWSKYDYKWFKAIVNIPIEGVTEVLVASVVAVPEED